MKTLAYLECPAGIAGDMCLGAVVDAGVPLDYLSEQLDRLGISEEYHLRVETVHRNGQVATKVHVDLRHDLPHLEAPSHPDHSHADHSHGHHSHAEHSHADHSHAHSHSHSPATRHLPEIEHRIRSAQLPPRAEAWSLAVFRRLAEAEGAVHGISPDQVHFHEVGATDAIVDIVGTCLGLDWLGIDSLYCAAMPTGGGTVWAAHGRLPVPVPAVLKLWEMRQVPIYSNGIDRELVTPTGAAIATALATAFGAPPPMTLKRIGLGAGSRDFPIPNMVRLWIGEGEGAPSPSGSPHSLSPGVRNHDLRNQPQPSPAAEEMPAAIAESLTETIAVLQTQIDDLNPQIIGYLFDRLFEVGALDVFTQAIGMKKSRPGILITVICFPEAIAACETVLFRETSTLGIRRFEQPRSILYRDFETVETPYGPVQIKVARSSKNGPILNAQPEYEDCARLAQTSQVPWRTVHQTALHHWTMHHQTSD